MDINKALTFIESSFLSPLLKDSDITDISFNGENIFYHNLWKKTEINMDVVEIKVLLSDCNLR